MRYAICPLSVVALRREPSESSEMISQALFGEIFKVLERRANWSRIRFFHDGYEGWMSNKQYLEITAEQYTELSKEPAVYCAQSVAVCKGEKHALPILIGSRLPGFRDGRFRLAETEYAFEGRTTCGKRPKSEIAHLAKGFLGAPYLWGGRSFFGIDCSGFVQMCYQLCGHSLPRDAKDQAGIPGETLSFVEEAEEGDMAFFDNDQGDIIHVGIVLPEHRIIHASGQVRIDTLDQTGIFNAQANRYTHKLRLLKRAK